MLYALCRGRRRRRRLTTAPRLRILPRLLRAVAREALRREVGDGCRGHGAVERGSVGAVRAEVLAEYPSIPEVLNPIFEGLDMATLQKLNGRIQVGGEPAEAVARDYLTQAGVLD